MHLKIVLVASAVLAAACSGEPAAVKAPDPSGSPVTASAAPVPTVSPCVTKVADVKAGSAAKRKLNADLRAYAASRPGRVTAYARDLKSGMSVGYHQTAHDQITASGAKIEILVTLLRQARADHRKLSANERSLATQMITQSDNKAADALYSRIGGASGLSATYRKLKMKATEPGPSVYWGGTKTSPADRVRLVTALAEDGHGLHADDREYVLGLMRKVVKDQKWGVSAAAAPGDEVALKNGWTPRPFVNDTWAVTSTGLITGPDRSYAVSVLTDVQPGVGTGISTIEHIADMIEKRMPGLAATVEKPC